MSGQTDSLRAENPYCDAVDANGHPCEAKYPHDATTLHGVCCPASEVPDPQAEDWVYVITDPPNPDAIALGRKLAKERGW